MAKNVKFKCACGSVHLLKVVDGELKHEVIHARKNKEEDDVQTGKKKTAVKNDRNLVKDFIEGTGPFADDVEVEDDDSDSEDDDEEGDN